MAFNYHPDNGVCQNDILDLQLSCGRWSKEKQAWILDVLLRYAEGEFERYRNLYNEEYEV